MLTIRPLNRGDELSLRAHLAIPSIAAALPDFYSYHIDVWCGHIVSDPHSYAILLDDTLIGCCRLEKNHHSDFSYWIHPDYQGRGFATQINNKFCRMAISLGWKSISGYCAPDNLASQTVLKRCGFKENNNTWTKFL